MKGLIIYYCVVFVMVILGITGWVKCIIKLLDCDFDPIGKAEVLYGLGCFTPLGSIIGWFNFGI